MFVGSAERLRFATAHPSLRVIAGRTGLAARHGRAPREGRRPAIAVAGTAAEATAFLVAFAAALDGDLGRPAAQPASGERSANSVK